jgi:hypothetical protein
VEKVVRALNIFGAVALVALALYLGWALIGGPDGERAAMNMPVATTPPSR